MVSKSFRSSNNIFHDILPQWLFFQFVKCIKLRKYLVQLQMYENSNAIGFIPIVKAGRRSYIFIKVTVTDSDSANLQSKYIPVKYRYCHKITNE